MTKSLVLALLAAGSLCAADWSDTFIGYRTSTQYREPGIDGTVTKNIVQLGHASGWAYGSNFFNVDMFSSDRHDPVNNGTSGATEVYAVYRTSVSLSKVTGMKLAFGPVGDVSLTAGFDFNSKNTTFAPKKRMWVFGPTFHFALPKGFASLGLVASKEKNYNGIVGRDVDFDMALQLNAAWGVPFQMGNVGAEFKGFANYIGAKGKDGFGNPTKPETLANLAVLVDLGTVIPMKTGRVFAGLGFEYWNNKFGGANSDAPAPATNKRVTAPMFMVQVHF